MWKSPTSPRGPPVEIPDLASRPAVEIPELASRPPVEIPELASRVFPAPENREVRALSQSGPSLLPGLPWAIVQLRTAGRPGAPITKVSRKFREISRSASLRPSRASIPRVSRNFRESFGKIGPAAVPEIYARARARAGSQRGAPTWRRFSEINVSEISP